MSLDVSALRADALDAVKELSSAPWLHRRVEAGVYNPETGSTGAEVTTETPVWGWMESLKAGFSFAGGSLVQAGDFRANVIAGQVPEVRQGDQFDIGGRTLTVVYVDPLPGLDMRVYDSCQVRL